MSRVQEYINLKNILDGMVHNGRNDLDPVCRSIGRKMWKLYKGATEEEQSVMDFEDNIYFG